MCEHVQVDANVHDANFLAVGNNGRDVHGLTITSMSASRNDNKDKDERMVNVYVACSSSDRSLVTTCQSTSFKHQLWFVFLIIVSIRSSTDSASV